MNRILQYILILMFATLIGSNQNSLSKQHNEIIPIYVSKSNNTLNYVGSPKNIRDKQMLMFSDQGAWFGFSFPDATSYYGGFSGPFLMTQQNGVWISSLLLQLDFEDVSWNTHQTNSYNSHLTQTFSNNELILKQDLVFSSGHTAIIKSTITNYSEKKIHISFRWKNQQLLAEGLLFFSADNELTIASSKTNALGHLIFPKETSITNTDSTYITTLEKIFLKPKESKVLQVSQSFIFPEYSWETEKHLITNANFDSLVNVRKLEKELQLASLINNRKPQFKENKYAEVLIKAHLTLQNNWRIPAGEIKYGGLFPSYHYKWFNGFWSWDSWKHAVGLSYYNTDLAKNQMRAMFDFQKEDGFIVDCIFRDTTIETHNYRNTKPPLSAWAMVKIFEKAADVSFLKEMYPKLKKYHYWWYNKRDHDKDGLCEYGSTDGSLVAAKWESGMDNAIRFDDSKILKNKEGAYSLDQESVDLNSYLYAEKIYLISLAEVMGIQEDVNQYQNEAKVLKIKIQQQFYDTLDGWFYDTNIEGNSFIKGEGSEGWIALWANVATQTQADAVKNKMMDPEKFYKKVPFQTISAEHSKFDPLNGYWRGSNWLDQAYFGIKGLRNYGFNKEADKATIQILEGAEGVLEKGKSIRENYHPITGEGRESQNFSWSAAHIIMLLMED